MPSAQEQQLTEEAERVETFLEFPYAVKLCLVLLPMMILFTIGALGTPYEEVNEDTPTRNVSDGSNARGSE